MNKENKQLFSRQAIKAVGLSAVKRPQMVFKGTSFLFYLNNKSNPNMTFRMQYTPLQRDCPYCHEKVATAQFGSHVELCVEAQEVRLYG